MDKIEVKVLNTHGDPGATAGFLARLTQRGHKIKNMEELEALYNKDVSTDFVKALAALPHGTIKRFTPITVAIVGASRRLLAQARTNQVGFNYVSASLQYSNYSDGADFVVPYALLQAEADGKKFGPFYSANRPGKLEYISPVDSYLTSCVTSMMHYKDIADLTDHDTAGYAAPQGLRNILIMQGNHQAWEYFIRMRTCNRNTSETQYVALRIWEELLKTPYGEQFFELSGPDCMHGRCREGKMCCGNPMKKFFKDANEAEVSVPRLIIDTKWPLLNK